MKAARPEIRRPASLRAELAAPSRLKTGLALGLSSLLPLGVGLAQAEDATRLDAVKVQDSAVDPNPNAQLGVPYKAKTSGDERHSRPLAETPQTITVLTKAEIDDSGATELRTILDAQPGITLGTGENGNAFGDRYVIRGQEARSDVFVDGLRDPGMTIRESFAVEQVEISKGPNSSFAGRGTAGGAINAITKQATRDYNFAKVGTGFGSDRYTRLSADVNQAFGEHFAVRGNALYGYEQVPDRAPADRERKGAALSALYKLDDSFGATLDYYGLRAEDNPDLGTYLQGTLPDRKPAGNVPAYVQKPDFLRSDVDTYTARIRYQFTPQLHISSLTRQGLADNGYVATGARSATTNANDPNGVYNTATLSTHQGWQEVNYFANQTNLFFDTSLLGQVHQFIFGLEYTDHGVRNGNYTVSNSGQNCYTGSSATANSWCIFDASGAVVNGLSTLMNRQITRAAWDSDWQVKTIAVALMDTVKLSERWTTFAGLRVDRYDFTLKTQSTATPPVLARYEYKDTLYNGHLGVTYQLTPAGMLYASYASAADINGGESDVGTNSGYGGAVIINGQLAPSRPERSDNVELGSKWNLFDEKLLMSAALFQITKADVMEGSGNGYTPSGSANTGKNRVRGVELGLSGEISDALMGQAGVSYMKAEVLESAVNAANVGKTLSNFANASAYAQLRYAFTDAYALGGTLRYEGKRYAGQPDTAAAYDATTGAYSQPIPAYTVLDLFATYQHSRELSARLNVGNVTNRDYYLAGYRSGSFVYIGDARNVKLTLNYEFD